MEPAFELMERLRAAAVEAPTSTTRSVAFLAQRSLMRVVHARLGERTWKAMVDGRDHRHGAAAYDRGVRGRPEPGYLDGMLRADRYVHETLGVPLTLQRYARIHDLALRHRPPDERGFRDETTRAAKWVGQQHRDWAALAELEPEPLVDLNGVADGSGRYCVRFQPLARAEVQARAEELLDELWRKLARARGRRQRLDAIVSLHQSLERLRPFVDGNARTHRLVLNKLLAESGLGCALLHAGEEVLHATHATWCGHVEAGLARWRAEVASVDARSRARQAAAVDALLDGRGLGPVPDGAVAQLAADVRARGACRDQRRGPVADSAGVRVELSLDGWPLVDGWNEDTAGVLERWLRDPTPRDHPFKGERRFRDRESLYW